MNTSFICAGIFGGVFQKSPPIGWLLMSTHGSFPSFDADRFEAVAIGSSTGGPGLLNSIAKGLPADLPFPIFIAQHLPPSFTQLLAQQMAASSPLAVVHAQHDMQVLPGVIYLAPGRRHMRVKRGLGRKVYIDISDQPAELFYKPSVDELFTSVAAIYGRRTLGVIMTGIGQDGTRGASAICKAGGVVVTQSEKTCSVYGMPRSCDEAGLSQAQLDPSDICKLIRQFSPGFRREMVGT